MQTFFETLKNCVLFSDITEAELEKMLDCLHATMKKYPKDSTIVWAEDSISSIGIIVSGNIQVSKEDYCGNKNILAELSASEIFAEVFVCAGISKSPVTVRSVTACEVLFVDYSRILLVCPSACDFHTKLIQNMLRLLANKSLLLNQKIEFLSKRTTKEKLLSYLTVQAENAKSKYFVIPFSRNALADFLCVDRSAMSRELCRLRDEGRLRFKGNQFELLY